MKGFAPWPEDRIVARDKARWKRIMHKRARRGGRHVRAYMRKMMAQVRQKNIAARSKAILDGTVKPNRFGLVTIGGVVMRARPVSKLKKGAQKIIRRQRRAQ